MGGVRGGGVGGCKGVCGGKVGGICINSHFKLIKGWGCWGGGRVCSGSAFFTIKKCMST